MKTLILINITIGFIKILFTSLHCYISWNAQQPKFMDSIHKILDILEKIKDTLMAISFILSIGLIFKH